MDLAQSKKNIGISEQSKILDLLIEDIKLRDHTGEKKYGTRLQPFNGRKCYKDAYEEFLDATVYLRAEYFEATQVTILTRDSQLYAQAIQSLYSMALDCSLKLRYLIEMKKEQNGKSEDKGSRTEPTTTDTADGGNSQEFRNDKPDLIVSAR